MESPTVAAIVMSRYEYLAASFFFTLTLIGFIDYWRKSYPETFRDFDFAIPMIWLGGNMLIMMPALPLDMWVFIVSLLSFSAAWVIFYSVRNVSINRREAREAQLRLQER